MPEFETYNDNDPDEFIDNCSEREIKELIESLVDSGYISRTAISTPDDKKSVLDLEWDEIMDKLIKNRVMLSNEEEEMIRNISKRF
jgi:hypothetical protein